MTKSLLSQFYNHVPNSLGPQTFLRGWSQDLERNIGLGHNFWLSEGPSTLRLFNE